MNDSLLLSVLFPFACVASVGAQEAPVIAADEPAVAGARRGTERWIVHFDKRSFDLSDLAAAHAPVGPQAQRVARVVARLEEKVRMDQAPFVRFVEARAGAVVEQWWIANACVVEIDPARLGELRRHPNVARVQPDRHVAPSFIATATNARNHNADAAHAAGVRGKGVTIAILDSGLDSRVGNMNRPHRTFFVKGDPNDKTGGGLQGSRLLANIRVGQQSEDDILGHGTAVAGVAAGERWRNAAESDRGHAPLSSVVGYSLSDRPDGWAMLTTIVRAWQQVARDKSRYGIQVANMSYEGTANPLSIEQQAIDAAARAADLVVTLSAGNDPARRQFSHGATNVLAVGSVQANNRVVASFSRLGPLPGDLVREYPNLVANGVQIVMPKRDDESSDRVSSGSSYAAPQVAGAAALYRSVRTSATALETRAAIVATAEDVRGKNRTAPFNTPNAYGVGYLRDDWLVRLAQRKLPNLVVNSTLDQKNAVRQYTFPAKRGRHYAAAFAYDRPDTNSALWGDVALVVVGKGFASVTRNPRNTHERLTWQAPRDENVTVMVVLARSTRTQPWPFSLVVTEALPAYRAGKSAVFGRGCPDVNQRVPELRGVGPFEAGRTYSLDVSRAGPGSFLLTSIGAGRTSWGSLRLPLDLERFGAPGCFIRSSIEDLWIGVSDQSGRRRRSVTVPPDNALIGVTWYHQTFVRRPSANTLQWIATNALSVTLGGDPN